MPVPRIAPQRSLYTNLGVTNAVDIQVWYWTPSNIRSRSLNSQGTFSKGWCVNWKEWAQLRQTPLLSRMRARTAVVCADTKSTPTGLTFADVPRQLRLIAMGVSRLLEPYPGPYYANLYTNAASLGGSRSTNLQIPPFFVGLIGRIDPFHSRERTSSTHPTRFSKLFLRTLVKKAGVVLAPREAPG
jgi:hypothetical protein